LSFKELSRLEKTKEARKKKKALLKQKMEKNQQTLQAIQSKDEIVELGQINEKIEELTYNVKHELRHLQKPLRKFHTLVNNPGYSLLPEATIKLDEYLENPFIALATEKKGYPLLKSILQKIRTALDNKKMKLKPSRMRKAKDQIALILNKTALSALHKDCSEALKKKRELSKSGAISETRDKRANLQERFKELNTKKRLLEAREDRFKKQHKEAQTRVEKQKKAIEKVLSDLSGKTVQLVLE
jgi:hypothetical protein